MPNMLFKIISLKSEVAIVTNEGLGHRLEKQDKYNNIVISK